MRVLAIGNMYPPHSLGGYELVWASTMEYLTSAGHEVRVLTSDFRREDVGEPEPDHVSRELRWYWSAHEIPRLGPGERLAVERHNRRVLARHLSEFVPDLVSWWAMGGMSLSLIERVRRAGLPAAGVVCDEWMVYGPKVDGWLRAFAGRERLGRAVERVTGLPTRVDLAAAGPWLFLSATLKDRIRAAIGPIDGVVSHRGVERELFAPAPERPWAWRVLYAGRIDPRKGIDLAIEALTQLPPESSLQVNGTGDEGHLAELRALAERLGVGRRVRFAWSPREHLPQAYADADVVVFPVRWEEPWGLVPLEAMAVGRPVIATGRGGSGEYLSDGENCLLFDPDDGSGALADRVRRLAGDLELRRRLRAGGEATSASLSVERWERDIERLHARALRGRT